MEHWGFIGLDTGTSKAVSIRSRWSGSAACLPRGQAKTILLTHHQFFSAYEAQGERLEAWVQRFLIVQKIDGWL